MTRFVVDVSAVLHLASSGVEVPGAHELLAPTLLRSLVRSVLHEAVQLARSVEGIVAIASIGALR